MNFKQEAAELRHHVLREYFDRMNWLQEFYRRRCMRSSDAADDAAWLALETIKHENSETASAMQWIKDLES